MQYEQRCKIFLENIQNGKIKAVTSQLALMETHYATAKYLGKATANKAIYGLLSLPIEFVDLNSGILQEALHRTEEHDLSIFDAVHLATALANDAEVFYSYDKDFDNKDILRREP